MPDTRRKRKLSLVRKPEPKRARGQGAPARLHTWTPSHVLPSSVACQQQKQL